MQEVTATPAGRPHLSVVPTLDEVATKPDLASGLPRSALLALHARAVRALAALQGPLLDAACDGHPVPEQPVLLDAKQVAERLHVPESWVRDMARQGKLRSVRLGHYVRFRPADLDEFVAGSTAGDT